MKEVTIRLQQRFKDRTVMQASLLQRANDDVLSLAIRVDSDIIVLTYTML